LQIYNPKKDIFQQKKVFLDEAFLQRLSERTWGVYFRASDEWSLDGILTTIARLERSQWASEIISQQKSRQVLFLYILLLCFIPLVYIVFFKKIQL
jgi:hypothetical protein